MTAFVQSLTAVQEAGFYLRQNPLETDPDVYDIKGDLYFPELTVNYTTSVPEPGALFLAGIPLLFGLWLGKRKAHFTLQ